MNQNSKRRMPLVAILWIVADAVLLMLCMSGFVMSNLEQMLVMFLCALAVIAALIAGFAWDVLDPFRKGMRGFMTVVPTAFFGLGLLMPLYVLVFRPSEGLLLMNSSATYGYNTVASLSFMLFAVQVLELFFLPTLALAASYGNRFDVRHYRVHSCVNAVLLVFNVFVSSTDFIGLPQWDTANVVSPTWYIPNFLVPSGASDLTMVQVVVLAAAAIAAGLSFLPLSFRKATEK